MATRRSLFRLTGLTSGAIPEQRSFFWSDRVILRKKWTEDFTVIPNKVFRSNLSAEATGVLCYLIGKPEDWTVSSTSLARFFGCGSKRVQRIMRELQVAGYAVYRSGGLGGGADWHITDDPTAVVQNDAENTQNGAKKGESQKGRSAKRDKRVLGVLLNTDKEQSTEKRKRFAPPSVEDVRAYAREKGITLNAQDFVDFYASKGWLVGKSPMKCWRSAANRWARSNAKTDEPRQRAWL